MLFSIVKTYLFGVLLKLHLGRFGIGREMEDNIGRDGNVFMHFGELHENGTNGKRTIG